MDLGALRLVVVPDDSTFNRMSGGRVPDWGLGLTFPDSRTIVLRGDDPAVRGTLRHELAHLALHTAVAVRVPLWFDEGYAAWAAGEFGRLDQWSLNLAVIRRRVPSLRELDGSLRGSLATAGTAYGLATSAVMELARRNPTGTLEPLMARLAAGEEFPAAVLATTGYPMGGFDLVWQKSVRRRYGVLTWLAAGGMWLILGGVVVWASWYRRRRDGPRRARLDDGWLVEGDWRHSPPDGGTGTVSPEGQCTPARDREEA